jgi:hypothetical protein
VAQTARVPGKNRGAAFCGAPAAKQHSPASSARISTARAVGIDDVRAVEHRRFNPVHAVLPADFVLHASQFYPPDGRLTAWGGGNGLRQRKLPRAVHRPLPRAVTDYGHMDCRAGPKTAFHATPSYNSGASIGPTPQKGGQNSCLREVPTHPRAVLTCKPMGRLCLRPAITVGDSMDEHG